MSFNLYANTLTANGLTVPSGTVSLPAGSVSAASLSGVLASSNIPNLSASNLTSGVFSVGSFGTSVTPNATNAFSLGTSSSQWSNVFASTGNFSSNLSVTGLLTASNGLTVSAGSVSLPNGSITASSVGNIPASQITSGAFSRKVWNAGALGIQSIAANSYFKQATLLDSGNTGSAQGLRIVGQLGGFGNSQTATIDCTIVSRGNFYVRGTIQGFISGAKQHADIVVYIETNGQYSVYYYNPAQFSVWDLSIEGGFGTTLYEPTSTASTAPTGTLVTSSVLSLLNMQSEFSSGTVTTAFNNFSFSDSAVSGNPTWTVIGSSNSGAILSGSITSGQLNPSATATCDLGASGTAWRNAYLSSNISVGGSITGSNGLTISGGTVSLPSGSISASSVGNLPASQITSGTFSVGSFGGTNISTTGTLAAGASTLGALTCTTISTENSNITVGSGSITSGQHNPTANATYDLGASATAWRSAYLSSNLSVGGAITGSNGLTVSAGSVSLPSASVAASAIGNLPASQITSGAFLVGTHAVNVSASNASSTQFGLLSGATTNSAQFGLAGGASAYSTDAVLGDAILRANGGNLLLQTGVNASAICINNTSNYVGLGTKSPQYQLDVAGTVNASGAFNAAATGGLICSVTNIGTGTARSLGSFALTKSLWSSANGPLDTSNVHNYASLSNIFSGGTIQTYNLNISGYINIPAAANYTFSSVGVDDSLRWYIDGSLVLSAGLNLNGSTVSSSTITFATAGWKNITIVQQNTGGNQQFRLQWAQTSGTTFAATDIPGSNLAYDQTQSQKTALGGPCFADPYNNRLGVGTVSPNNMLHVSGGTAQFDSNVTVANALTVSGAMTCASSAIVSGGTGPTFVSTTYAGSLNSGQYIISPYGVAGSANNCGFTGFNYTGGAGASTNYYAFGVRGYLMGSQSFNACANGNFGICTTTPSYLLDVNGTFRASTVTTFGGSCNIMPGILAVNDQTDSGTNRGIRYWQANDSNWATYMCTSGAGKSSAGGSTCTSLDNRTAHHIRNRVGNNNNQGFLWENSSESCLMSLTGDTGNLFIKGTIGSSSVRVGGTAYPNGVDCTSITTGSGSATCGALSASTGVLGQSTNNWAKRTFSITGQTLYSTPMWWKIAAFWNNGAYCSGCLTITGLLGHVSGPVNFTANIGFHTQNPSWNASLVLDSPDSTDPFASGTFDIALYIDNSKNLFVYAKQNMDYLTMSLDVTTCQFEGNVPASSI
ncbi:hypothetical protein KFL_010840040 [Klebsormidium nitens]|uniref:PA14 domain-containing protein n=1 Tax=Klebsormidium nitens TaxID=105231 RepID=A0A1Y1IRI5_KLENI|nr:hypothetical protein KFL_010840040 [Klebsormidium nitens]|eukprot:GAQ92652.1 hypothetical protein KFL_010840040 [Klebsormidium nitens]